jgi:hypothetical protein
MRRFIKGVCPYSGKTTEKWIRLDGIKSGAVVSCGCIHESKGIIAIKEILDLNGHSYKQEKTFDTCKFEGSLRFDLFVDEKYLIEFDGEQHFAALPFFGGEEDFVIRQKRDLFKNEWCLKNNIPLIRIPYWHEKEIELKDLIPETSSFLVKE